MDREKYFFLEGLPGDSAKDKGHQGWFDVHGWFTTIVGRAQLHLEIGSIVAATSLQSPMAHCQVFRKARIEEIETELIKGVVKKRVVSFADFKDLKLEEVVWRGSGADGIARYRITFFINVGQTPTCNLTAGYVVMKHPAGSPIALP